MLSSDEWHAREGTEEVAEGPESNEQGRQNSIERKNHRCCPRRLLLCEREVACGGGVAEGGREGHGVPRLRDTDTALR